MAVLFDKQIIGQINFSNQEIWVDLGVITSGLYAFFGFATFTCDGKNIVFELRTNKIGFSDGVLANTNLHDRVQVRDGDSRDREYYRGNLSSRQSEISTGVEHMWLRLRSKSSNNADAYWWIDYTEV